MDKPMSKALRDQIQTRNADRERRLVPLQQISADRAREPGHGEGETSSTTDSGFLVVKEEKKRPQVGRKRERRKVVYTDTVSFRLTQEHFDLLEEVANKRGETVTATARDVLENFLNAEMRARSKPS